ncbi:glycosyltransferase [Paraburkholderia sp. HD33-4]|uniref:glycosyltransferase n=1 Tax=Paraburkholderia sp. HD33-4 TaxID=2883242 RepID=UPI001F3F4073|nr:glycosyltransferase [Paraburkholderia sp. HD33-4]
MYLALGPEHAALAALSISFLRRFGYSGPIRVVTDAAVWPEHDYDCEIVKIKVEHAPRWYKTQINQFGFDVTLFLDSDILIISKIDHIWENICFAELCISLESPQVRDFINYYWERSDRMRPELAYMHRSGLAQHAFYNSGVLLFRRSEKVERMFNCWHEEWRRFGGRDQCALVRALVRTGIKVQLLPRSWNCPPTHFQSIADAQRAGIKMMHFFSGPQRLRLPALLEKFDDEPGVVQG